MPDHPGYDVWGTEEPGFPYPIGPIKYFRSTKEVISGAVEVTIPASIPEKKSFSERGVGINLIGKLAFAVRFDEQPNGSIELTAVMEAHHAFFWPEHGEKGPGKQHTFVIPHARLQRSGREEMLIAHGQHTDSMVLWWLRDPGSILFNLSVWHYESSVESLRRMEEDAKKKSRKRRYIEVPFPYVPPSGKDTDEEKKPKPKAEEEAGWPQTRR